MNNKRDIFGALSLLAIGAICAILAERMLFSIHTDRRYALYSIMCELKREMPRSEVEKIISRHDAPFIERVAPNEEIMLRIHMGGRNWLYLLSKFSQDKLVSANFGGEDNPQDVPKDAPPNI